MIKGWRNDPQWVAYFEKKQEAKLQRQIDMAKTRMKAKMEVAMARVHQGGFPRASGINCGIPVGY